MSPTGLRDGAFRDGAFRDGAFRDRAFWDWAVAAYAAPEVADTCLALQDTHGQDVPLLLWAAWCAATGRRPDEDDLDAAIDTARVWRDAAIVPLRELRRRLKSTIPDMDQDDRLAVREQVKAVELDAERRMMAALERLAPAQSAAPRPTLEALVELSRRRDRTTPRPALALLAERLPA
jgi:uncharacterized protein (TIGR02444 family)